MNEIESNKKSILIILAVSIYICKLILGEFINPIIKTGYINFSLYFIILYNSFFCILIYFFANPFKWTKELASSRKLSDKFYSLKRNIVIGFMMLIILSKTCYGYYVNHTILPEGEFDEDRKIINLIMFVSAGVFEEMFFKGLLLRFFKSLKLNDVLCYIFISLLFAAAHLNFSFAFIPPFLVSLFSLLLFRLFPSITFFSIIHVLWNIATFI